MCGTCAIRKHLAARRNTDQPAIRERLGMCCNNRAWELLRQQVIDGSRWISRAASNVTSENFPIRSAFIGHSSDEHRDFEMIERDYVSVGGKLEVIRLHY